MRKKIFTILLALAASVGMSWATTTDLASITDNYTAQDGEILTGTLGVNVKISIADGATVTLLNANINGDKTWKTGEYAGLTCLGDATITIVGKNSVSGFYADDLGNGYPGIYVPSGKTLIINGTGSLTAQSSTEEAAGIGARVNMSCGNIEIQSGKITAIACGEYGAGIGGAYNASCGNITISGGIVTAVGGDHCAGIGGGRRGAKTDAGHCGNILISGGVVSATSGEAAAAIGGGRGNNNNYKTNCGTITITNTALKVYAEQGGEKGSTNTIGAAKYGNNVTVTIGGNTGVINDDPYTYRTKEDGEIVVVYINAIGTVVYTQECKDKIDIARELYDALEDSQKTLVTNYQTLLDAEDAYAALIPQPAPANLCGGGLTWELKDGALTISYDGEGTGVMNDFEQDSSPWKDQIASITSVVINEGAKNIGKYAFYECEYITTVTLANSVETIGEGAFRNCEDLASLELGNNIKTIEQEAFLSCSVLKTVTIGTGITSIGTGAFYGCEELTTVTCEATTPPILGMAVFESCPKLKQIYVPTESVDAYKTAWSVYTSIISAAGGGSTPTVWTALKVGDVIKVGDKIEVPAEGDGSWGINGNVLRNAWGPYTLIRADIYQASEFDDPVVTETEDGAFYVLKAENSNFYPFSNLGKGTGLVVTMTSDGLEVTAAANKEFTVAVHENGDAPTGVENVQPNPVQATKILRNGMLFIEKNGKIYNVMGAEVK